MLDFGKCQECGGTLEKKEERIIGGTKYYILKCEKCNKQIARRAE